VFLLTVTDLDFVQKLNKMHRNVDLKKIKFQKFSGDVTNNPLPLHTIPPDAFGVLLTMP